MSLCVFLHHPRATKPHPWLFSMDYIEKNCHKCPIFSFFHYFFLTHGNSFSIKKKPNKTRPWHFLRIKNKMKQNKRNNFHWEVLSFGRKTMLLKLLFLKSAVARVRLKIFGWSSSAMKTVFEMFRFTVKPTFQPSHGTGSRKSWGALGTTHPGDTEQLFCHSGGGKKIRILGHLLVSQSTGAVVRANNGSIKSNPVFPGILGPQHQNNGK